MAEPVLPGRFPSEQSLGAASRMAMGFWSSGVDGVVVPGVSQRSSVRGLIARAARPLKCTKPQLTAALFWRINTGLNIKLRTKLSL